MKCVVLSTLGVTKRVTFGSLASWITFYQNFTSMHRKLSQNCTSLHCALIMVPHIICPIYQTPTFFGLHTIHCHVKSRERQSFFLWKKQCVQNNNFIVKALDRLLQTYSSDGTVEVSIVRLHSDPTYNKSKQAKHGYR